MSEQIRDHHSRLAELFKGIGGDPEAIAARLNAGNRCVRYEWCASLILATLRRPSRVYITQSRGNRFLRGIPYSLLSLGLGLWGVPWGWVWTPRVIGINLLGGIDMTAEIRELLTAAQTRPDALNTPSPPL